MAVPVNDSVSVSSGKGVTLGYLPAAPVELTFDPATPEQISIYCPTNRPLAAGTTAQVRYKLAPASTWKTAHPLLHVLPSEITDGAPVAVQESLSGVIFDLMPGTLYEVEVTVSEPGNASFVLTAQQSTRELPANAGVPNKTANTSSSLQTILNGLVPGDVLELSNGTYNLTNLYLNCSGTENNPIFIRGIHRDGVILKAPSDAVLTVLDVHNVVIENLTLEGSGVDSGTSSSSSGVIFNTSYEQSNVTLRFLTLKGVDIGIKAYTRVTGCLVYGCILSGNNTWDKAYVINPASGLPNYTWNDDGICLGGVGNAAWNNTLRGFGDSFALYGSYSLGQPLGHQSVAVFYYRNLVEWTGDDACEADYTTRNLGFYDNYIANAGTLLSVDPVWGGPLYCFRNTAINLTRGPFKLTNQNSGFLSYNNTVVKTDGTAVAGWYVSNNGVQNGWSHRNNLLVHRGVNPTFRFEAEVNRIDFNYNSWYAEAGFNWTNSGGNFPTLVEAVAGLPNRPTLFGTLQRHANDNVIASNPWVETVTLGADHTTQYTLMQRLELSGGPAKNSGVAIPGITDGFSGGGPDRGAEIAGRTPVIYGSSGVGFMDAWTVSLVTGTWAELPSVNTLQSVNPDNDPTANPNYPGTAPWRSSGFGSHAGMVTGWCGAAQDEVGCDIWWNHAGGHNDNHANGAYRLALDRPLPIYERVLNPSGSVGFSAVSWNSATSPFKDNLAEMSDGRPRSHHTENFQFYWPGKGPGLASEILIAPSGGSEFGRNRPNLFSPITGERTFLGANKNNDGSGSYCASTFDSKRQVVWKMPSGSFAFFSKWGGPDNDVWTDVGPADYYFSGPVSLTYWPGTDLILVGNGGDDLGTPNQTIVGGFGIFDPQTGILYARGLTGTYPTFTGAPTTAPQGLSSGLWPGMCQPRWSARLKAFLAWDMTAGNTTKILRITPPVSGDPRTGTWNLDYLPVSPSNTVTPSAKTLRGTYGRFWLMDSKGICGVINSVTEKGYVFKYI